MVGLLTGIRGFQRFTFAGLVRVAADDEHRENSEHHNGGVDWQIGIGRLVHCVSLASLR